MIRLSRKEDVADIVALWQEAFGDSEEDVFFFLNSNYIPENTVVFDDNGRIVSVFFLLSGDMRINGVDYPSYYLYAAATLKSYRGKGIMGQMLEFAKNLASSRGVEFICLRPADKSLFDYYAKHGYKTVFYSKKVSVSADQFLLNDETCDEVPANLAQIRDNYLSDCDYFRWSEKSIRFALEHNQHFGGTNKFTCKSYSLYSMFNENLYVKETTLTGFENLCISTSCLKGDLLYKVVFNLPAGIETDVEEYEIVPDGMAVSCGKTDVENIRNGYLGLTLE